MNAAQNEGDATTYEEEKEAKKQKRIDQKNQVRKKKLEAFVSTLPKTTSSVDSVLKLLKLILPILKIILDENIYRYFLGMISFHCPINNKQLIAIAHCGKKTLDRGKREYKEGIIPDFIRHRKGGAGRKPALEAPVRAAILEYVRLRSYGPCTKGIREYTAATLESIQSFIQEKFHYHVSRSTIQLFLEEEGIRLRTNKKLLYANQNKETEVQKVIRHSQFELIFKMYGFLDDPRFILVSMDCKKKEILGPFKCLWKSYSFKDEDVKVDQHDFAEPLKVSTLIDVEDLLDRTEGKAIPFGFYDIAMNKAYISVGISHDTPEFIARSLLRYIDRMKADHPEATNLVLFCDGGGSNNARSHIFKKYVEELSSKIHMKIYVIHYPPYKSKFNKIERHVFAPISKKFERSVLYNLRTVLALINNTTTKTGLECVAELDANVYETGIKVTDEEYGAINITYLLSPNGVNTHLAYVVDGTGKSTHFLDKDQVTVFDIKHNIDLSKEEKIKLAQEKAAKKANTAAERQAKSVKPNSQKKKSPKKPVGKTEKVAPLPI